MLTQEIIQDKMRFQMERAKKELLKAKPESDPDIAPIPHGAVAIWSSGVEKTFTVGWKNLREKHIWAAAISDFCKLTHVSAIIGRYIGTGVVADEVYKELNLDKTVSIEEYEQRLRDWVRQTTNQSRFAGLPAKFRRDAIVIFAIGPRIKDAGLIQLYEWSDSGWIFLPSPSPPDAEMQSSLIPKWWQ